jgi:tRNA(fMet)-specific endonuclease VapC
MSSRSKVFRTTSRGRLKVKSRSAENSGERAVKVLLNTDTCIYALKHDRKVLAHLLSSQREDVGLSVITEAELRTGAAKSSSAAKTLRLVENFLRPLTIVEFNSDDAIVYAQIRAKLERAGTPIRPLDTLIAAQAIARQLILVTNNGREFRRVAGLSIENWMR